MADAFQVLEGKTVFSFHRCGKEKAGMLERIRKGRDARPPKACKCAVKHKSASISHGAAPGRKYSFSRVISRKVGAKYEIKDIL